MTSQPIDQPRDPGGRFAAVTRPEAAPLSLVADSITCPACGGSESWCSVCNGQPLTAADAAELAAPPAPRTRPVRPGYEPDYEQQYADRLEHTYGNRGADVEHFGMDAE